MIKKVRELSTSMRNPREIGKGTIVFFASADDHRLYGGSPARLGASSLAPRPGVSGLSSMASSAVRLHA